MTGAAGTSRDPAVAVLAALGARGWTLGVAESLTGGLVCARLVAVPGASAVLRGGVVAYATYLKARVLHVDEDLLAARGPVDPDVAVQMAEGARQTLAADVGVATTGVAGPEPQGDAPVGTVHVAVATPDERVVRSLLLPGSREQVRDAAADAALGLLRSVLDPRPGGAVTTARDTAG